ncbi:MAG: hypothetical protein JSS43_20175, partial [Proteobacteria bacterium]|nr:hypothetical protein [Pseudomonadota bacterium]
MTQGGRDWDEEDGDSPDDASDWLRPVWADDDADLDAPPLRRPVRPPPLLRPARATTTATDTLLAPLAAAAAALARLDAQAEAASPAVQQGLIARLTYAEAAGWLASQGVTAHPVSLALRDRERVGRRELWLQHKALRRTTPVWEEDDVWLAADEKIGRALTLARLLDRLPSADNPLVDHTRAEAWLGPLGPQACPFDAHRFTTWRAAHMPDGRRSDPRPALLRAADAALGWMEGGISDEPDAIQALAVVALLLKRMGAVEVVPPPLWAAWSALCAPDDPGVLPRLRGDTAARLAPDGASWPPVFLHLMAESARAGSRIVSELRVAEAAGLAFAAGEDKRSRLPATVDLLLRQPVLTAPALARRLDITPQASLRLFARLEQA